MDSRKPVWYWILLVEDRLPPGWFDAPKFCAEKERSIYQGFRFEQRRREWVLGRLAAKKLIQQVLSRPPASTEPGLPVQVQDDSGDLFLRSEEELDALRRIAVLPGADRAPRVQIRVDQTWQALDGSLSISHSGGRAFCAFAPGGAGAGSPASPGIGADIESIDAGLVDLVQEYLHPAELAWLKQATAHQSEFVHRLEFVHQSEAVRQQEAVLKTLLWSIKESALKSIRRGLTVDTRAPVCQPGAVTAVSQGWRPARVEWDVDYTGGQSYPPLEGWWRLLDEHILTIMGPMAADFDR